MKLASTGLLLDGACLLLGGTMIAAAQSVAPPPDFSSLTRTPKKNVQYVEYAADQQMIPAGKRTVLELRFHVVDGYHINSHQPKSDLQIPTRIELTPAAGVKLGAAAYPAGEPFSFSFAPADKLDVYQGEFIVRLPVTASAGTYEMTGALKYQACDHAACYPPKTLPIGVVLRAK